VNPIQQAASVLLARGPGSDEVFVVRRAESLRFMGGFIAFPGGKAVAADGDPHLLPEGAVGGEPPVKPERWVTAARELFEETGVLVARRADGGFPFHGPELDGLRRRMLEEEFPFTEVLTRLGLRLRGSDFEPLGTLTTPDFVPVRFETAFFVAHLPPGQEAHVWPGELEEGWWTTPAALLEQWQRGVCLVSPPTVMTLDFLRGRAIDEAPARLASTLRSLAAGMLHPIWFAPGVLLIPLHTQALPPSTHTNAYLVGSGPRYLLDPGPADPAEQARLFGVLDAEREAGRHLTAIVLTHHHPDHIGAANACARRYGVPIHAHPLTAQILRGKIPVDREIHEGDRLDLGTALDGTCPWYLEAIHTPGHAPGHLVFYEPHYRLLFAGDMVSTVSSVVIAPPDGDLSVYLQSLERLRGYDARLLLPGHGGADARPRQALAAAIAHRVKREEQLLAALGSAPRTVSDLALELYKGLPAPLMRFAELQLQAGLEKLRREGRAAVVGSGTTAAWHASG
jgi:glyoxylase-like metal-dependent hydrolase (beta-lactamase superfamily II)/8-oxo-dGTP pyrophosphatase MutT (NUDIX family)